MPKPAPGWTREAWKLLLVPFLLFIGLPLAGILSRASITQVFASLAQKEVIQAIQISLVTSLATVALAIVIGSPVAYYLSNRRRRWFHIIDTMVDLPTVLPPAVAGLALLMAFGRRGLLGPWLSAFGIGIPFTWAAVVMAQLFVAAPLYIKSAALGFGAVDGELKSAAAMDGATGWQIFRHIILPLAWTSLLSGGVMTWARALGEFGATIIFAGNFPGRTQTMPLAIYLGFELDLQVAIVLSILLIGSSFLTILLVKAIFHRTIQAVLQQ